ncbi:MAG: dihydropteroate synthase [Pseudomonadota bacterium]
MTLAGGWAWFTQIEVLSRSGAPEIIAAREAPGDVLARLTAARSGTGLVMARPNVMGILNATPDSFSDGGVHAAAQDAVQSGRAMISAGADILDVGGESTRPGAQTVETEEEIARVVPVIEGLAAMEATPHISIDTRKAAVARAALRAGAGLVNDVSGFTHDPALAPLCVEAQMPVCVMHGPLDPSVMQNDPHYVNVVLDVYDFLENQIEVLTRSGLPRSLIIADPGIGFGKTLAHNLALLARLSLFHCLGVPILLGASRKRFIGTISEVEQAKDRVSGSIGVALAALQHGVQVLRVHDVPQTVQAIALWRAAMMGEQA